MEQELEKLALEVGKQLERTYEKLNLDDCQKDILDEDIMAVLYLAISKSRIKQSKEEIRDMFFDKIKVPENIDELHQKSLENIQKKWCNCEGKKYSKYVRCHEHDN